MTDKKHHVSVQAIFNLLPQDEIMKIGQTLNVDFHARKLYGCIFLKLLIYGQLLSLKLSQRKLDAIYDSPSFKALNRSVSSEGLSHQSISARLKVMPSEYFQDIYRTLCVMFGGLLPRTAVDGQIICAVDSTMVSETAAKLKEGMRVGVKAKSPDARKLVKYTMSYDGGTVLYSQLHTLPRYLDEDNALGEAVCAVSKKYQGQPVIYTFDRGIKGGGLLASFDSENIRFVGRLNPGRRIDELGDCTAGAGKLPDGVKVLSDKMVQLYGKKGRSALPNRLRVVTADVGHPIGWRPGSITAKESVIVLITDELELTAAEILEIYKKRWKIESFFRFLKQELNFSHFISVNQNGMESILYITLITALLIKIYMACNRNNADFAKFRIGLELLGDLCQFLQGKMPQPPLQSPAEIKQILLAQT